MQHETRRGNPRLDRGHLQLKAAYKLSELVTLTGMNRHQLRRLLDQLGVRWLTEDPRTVTLAELRRAAPDLWDSVLEKLAITGS